MHRSIRIFFLVIVAAILLIGIQLNVYEPYVRNLTYEVIPDEDGNPGGGLKLTWEPPWDGPYRGSGCWGRSGDPEDWLYIIELDGKYIDTTGELEYHLYTPGSQLVVCSFNGDEDVYDEGRGRIELRSDIFKRQAYELSGPGPSGIGWSSGSGEIDIISMISEEYQDDIDCYFTDFAHNYGGTYHLASPSELVNDEGNFWLDTAGWRTSLVSGDLGDFDTITIVPPDEGNYSSTVPAYAGETYAVKTQDGYYGLVEVINISTSNGTIDIRAAFQKVQGLRWM